MVGFEEYKKWLFNLAVPDQIAQKHYTRLLEHLLNTEYYSTNDLDENRIIDGLVLRDRFIVRIPANEYDEQFVEALSKNTCSVLEMMVALAARIENQIMKDPNFGDRTHIWFLSMLANLGLEHMYDENWDENIFNNIMFIFLNRLYDNEGHGGNLFIVDNPPADMRSTDIWYQCMWWLDKENKMEDKTI